MFFKAQELVVLDVGSKIFSAMVATKKNQGVFYVKSYAETPYSGYENGEWFDIDELRQSAIATLESVIFKTGCKSKTLFVSIPAEFATTVTKDVAIILDRRRKVVDSDIDYLFKKGDTYESNSQYLPVNTSAIYFTVDDSSRLLIDPRGVFAGKISARASYILAERGFVELFDSIAKSMGFSNVEYISQEWAQGLTLLEKEQRDKDCLLINIGYLSSSVSVIRGEGLLELKSFSLGGAHITANIFESFDTPFEIAEEARNKVDLNLNYSDEDYIETQDEGGFVSAEIAEVVKNSLDILIETVASAIELCKYDITSYAPLYLTGNEIPNIRGAVNYIQDAFEKQIEVLSPRLPAYNKPHYASVVSLLTVASKLGRNMHGLLRMSFAN
ncbi:MAG TPA: cell division FtsA domain-containing protein [Clostridia bacterium]|nr:cell division FtsA domain-containing protein [Clostridia bacterium]